MQAIVLQIVGLLIVTTLLIMFFTKPNIENKETKTYSKLLILNLIFILVGIATYFVAHLTKKYTYIMMLQKIYMSVLALLNMYSMFYCISIYDKDNKYQKIKTMLLVITLISILLIIVLPLNVIFEGNLLDGDGPSYDVAIGHTILSFSFFIIVTIYFLIKKYSIKKILPYIILITLYLLGFLIRTFYKELIFEGFFYSYILLIMFNTIENPDVKMAKELVLIENVKIDENNINDVNNTLSKFQNRAIILRDKITSILDLAMVKSDTKVVTYKYETYDMIDRLKQLLSNEESMHSTKINVDVEKNMPQVLYGDENNVLKVTIAFFNFLSSIIENKKIELKINSIKVGNFAKIRFNFITDDKLVEDYIVENKHTKKLRIEKDNDMNYEMIKYLLAKLDGTITINKSENIITISLNINQRLVSEYDVISNKKENQNIKIKYHNYSDKRILIVDNNNLKIKELKILLSPYNVQTISTNNLSEMCDAINDNETFDLVFIDDIIPGDSINEFSKMLIKDNGVLNYIRRETKYPITTIVMITPNINNNEKEYLKLGFSDYIIKPINKKNLDDILNKYFQKNND